MKQNMGEYISIPRSVLSDDFWRDGNLARLCFYLFAKADSEGELNISMAAIERDLRLSRQTLRTLMKKIETNQILTKSVTNKVTNLKVDIQTNKPCRQPTDQPTGQPKANQRKTPCKTVVQDGYERFREWFNR